MPFTPRFAFFLSLLMGLTLSAGCQREEPEPEVPVAEPETPVSEVDPAQEDATRSAWNQGEALIEETLAASTELHESLKTLLEQPDTETLQSARAAWRRTHNQWHQLDPLLALADSNPGMFVELQRLALSIDAHPLQPGYLDYLENYPYSGIVNDITLTINADTLRNQHGLTDASDVSLGFHALEFLLWGENSARPTEDFTSKDNPDAEQREAGLTTADLPNNRRRDLTLLLSQLLRDDLKKFRTRWTDRNNHLFTTYHRLHPASRLQLLKNAAEQYLINTAQTLTTPEGEPFHNAFAGDNLEPLINGLSGLQNLFTQGDPALSKWLGEPEAVQRWLADLEAVIDQLREQVREKSEPEPNDETGLSDETGLLNEGDRQKLGSQLAELAEFLSPLEPEALPPPTTSEIPR